MTKRRRVWMGIAIAAAVVLVVAVIAGSVIFRMRGGMFFAHRSDMLRGHSMPFHGRGMMARAGGLGLFFGLLFIGGLVWLVSRAVGRHVICREMPADIATSESTDDAAMILLRQRYASGEIDDEEFQRIKTGLEG